MWTEPLYTAEEMKRAEAGHDVPTLMQRAGRAVAEEALRRFPDARSFGAVCGKGANGGDGRIALEVLRSAGRDAAERLEGDVLIDALFGTGFSGAPRPDAAEVIERLNAAGRPIVAVDVPSGVDASSGEVPDVAVRADLTVTFHGRKVGLAVAPGRFHTGDVVLADIGLEVQGTAHALVRDDVLRRVPRRGPRDTKYTAGSVLVVGGSRGMTGAAALAARAAFRADAGYVAIAAPAESLPVLETLVLEAVKRPLDDVFDAVERASALALGPGLGRGDDRKALVRRLLEELDLPTVVDADALYGLEPFERTAPTVLTPHSGELARLLGEDARWVDAHRLVAATKAAEKYRCTVLLKGADTLIAEAGAGVLVHESSEDGLATAGTGDVLTGVIAAFLAKGLDARTAAAAGAAAHTRAAAAAGKPAGLVAGDVVESLPLALA